MRLQPIANPEVMLGLTAMCIVRGLTGFMTFMLAFGLRRMKGVGLYWYGLVLASSGVGAIIGLVLVGRLRKHLTEQQLLLCSLWLIAATAAGCAVWGTLLAQVVLAFMVGLCGAVAQPSFDAMTQRYIPLSAQGRAFARFGMRQQLVWVIGSLIPVIIAFTLPQGDATMAVLAALGGLSYVSGRRAAHAPRVARSLPRDPRPGGHGTARGLNAARHPRGSAQAPLERVGLVGQCGREPVAELGVVLADQRHLGPPSLGVDPQELRHVLRRDVDARGVDGIRWPGTPPMGVSTASALPVMRWKTHSSTREFSP